MARRKRSSATSLRWLGALLLIALVGGVAGWWHMRHWQPERAAYPVQGVEIGTTDGITDWRAIKAIGADFAYIDASASAFARDPAFSRNLEEARAAKLRVGAVHRYDPCQPAERQAANFVSVVPRDAALLPPAVELDAIAQDCLVKVSDAKVESELMTFVNEVETHTGKAMLLKLSPKFEARYHIALSIDRNLWLTRDRFEPDYAGRPWTLWTANSALENEAGKQALRWVVVQP
jgi:lysozyme